DLQHGLAPTHAFANIGGGLQEVDRPATLAKGPQTELDSESLPVSLKTSGFDGEHRFGGIHSPHELLELIHLAERNGGKLVARNFRLGVSVHALSRRIPFEHSQIFVIEDHCTGKVFEQPAITFMGA